MAERFWMGAAVFHTGMVTASFVLARRWARRLAPPGEPFSWARAVGQDALAWATPAVLLALFAAGIGSNRFTAIRLLSQAFFGELIVLGSWVAALLWRSAWRRSAVVVALACTSLLAAYDEAYHREPTDLRVRRFSVDLSRAGAARGRFRVLHLSDIQADRVGSYQERAIRTALEQGADLVVMTGDYVQPRLEPTRGRATADLNRLLRRSGFEPRLGAYAVRGDVDSDWPTVFEGTTIRPLTGEIALRQLEGGAVLCVVGLTPAMSHGQDTPGLLELIRRAPPDCVRLVIGHGPDFVMDLPGRERIDLALAGHTHGGQVVLPWVGALFTKTALPSRYASGLHDYRGVPIHVSAGIGMERGTAPQIRFLCPPEFSVLDVTY